MLVTRPWLSYRISLLLPELAPDYLQKTDYPAALEKLRMRKHIDNYMAMLKKMITKT
jgi:hypothetical protein